MHSSLERTTKDIVNLILRDKPTDDASTKWMDGLHVTQKLIDIKIAYEINLKCGHNVSACKCTFDTLMLYQSICSPSLLPLSTAESAGFGCCLEPFSVNWSSIIVCVCVWGGGGGVLL